MDTDLVSHVCFITESLSVHVNICGQLIYIYLQERPSEILPRSESCTRSIFHNWNMGIEEDGIIIYLPVFLIDFDIQEDFEK